MKGENPHSAKEHHICNVSYSYDSIALDRDHARETMSNHADGTQRLKEGIL